ncbi:DUF6875 domain-containing protein [Paraburkholderia sp. BL10I2N1]|uniref:DUF6875 domain-containing protein n=1 Tax=Paraburkholderia sp. BL10I2N1 TaxID=1938796 RepID=UPI00105DE96B|nr:hypothetical protein [Paraburkholderia sp. BL10I2N1]TDN69287.1 hypothetical protein B0G77_2666 [Paraburkholderia sp. BL10I2N1]
MKNDIEASRSFLSMFDREIEKIKRSACLSIDIKSVPDQSTREVFESGLNWLAAFIMRPHAELGRRGAVCPFVKPAHHEGSLVFCIWDVTELPFDIFISILNRLPTLYHQLFADMSGNSRLCSICIFLNGLKEEQYSEYIDRAHSMVKPVFMEAGLMIGEFHPLSVTAGVHSRTFRPMRSDRPAFVVRAITPHDAMFIDRDGSPAEVRLRELLTYKSWVGAVLPEDESLAIEKRITELRLAIAGRS